MTEMYKAIGWLFLAISLLSALILYACLWMNGDDVLEIREERVMTPKITPPPEPVAEVKAVVTYPVPLSQELQDYIVQTCLDYEVSPCVVFAIIGVESEYDATKKGDFWDGRYHSFGLMQIYAEKHTDRCIRLNTYNLLDARQNVLTGIDYLAELLATGNSIDECLTFYNCGYWQEPGVYARTVLCNAEQILEGVMVSEP
jgi:soluble lytic murein transglycosylase-like protein